MKAKIITYCIGIAALFACSVGAEDFVRNPVGLDADVKHPFKEPRVWGGGLKKIPPDPLPEKFDWHVVLLNQIGFDVNEPKRFTAPVSPDGTKFSVKKFGDSKGESLFDGEIKGHIGDFSGFKPADSTARYVVVLSGGDLKDGASDPFYVRTDAYKKFFHQLAVDFMIDVRSVYGTHPSAYGGGPYRDGGRADDFAIPALVNFWLANSDEIMKMPRQIDYEKDMNRTFNNEIKYVPQNWAGPEVMRWCEMYFDNVEAPAKDAPDVIKLIHWSVGYYLAIYMEDEKKFANSGGVMEQISYFLWAYPTMKKWIPESVYKEAKTAVFKYWEKANRFRIPWSWDAKHYPPITVSDQKKLPPLAYGNAPGHTIIPNILMYEVAKREGMKDADKYLNAAIAQTEFVVNKVDFNNPLTTKAHRFSEHRTVTALVWMLGAYPDKAPKGLKEKILQWSDIMISRSDNMWDYRMLSPKDNIWTMLIMNDVGNLLCFPASAISANWVQTDNAKKSRMEEIYYAQIDAIFGRNPRMCAGVGEPKMGWNDVARGWPVAYKNDICARLELCRGSISTSCGTESYPFKPNGEYRHVEGWIMYGAVWMNSLAYMSFDRAGTRPWDAVKNFKEKK